MSFPGYISAFETWWGSLSSIADGTGSLDLLWQSPLQLTLSLMVFTTFFTFIASAINNNDSWVDRLWSISPVLYAWILAIPDEAELVTDLSFSTSTLFALLITIWGARLTYNFYRKGGYNCGGEDYRWNYVRSWAIFQGNRPLWLFFSFTIVSLYQCALLWAIAVPVMALPKRSAPTAMDWWLAAAFLTFLALETIADQQQWEFQNQKYKMPGFTRVPQLEGDYANGFCTHGVFAFSRHLNVWSEQSMWVVVFLAAASHSAPRELGIGCAVLVGLTVGSTTLTEGLSLAKYPKYAAYQSVTPMLVPSMMTTRPMIDRALRED
jgi:steroid 5-alpha reductase family enzyme